MACCELKEQCLWAESTRRTTLTLLSRAGNSQKMALSTRGRAGVAWMTRGSLGKPVAMMGWRRGRHSRHYSKRSMKARLRWRIAIWTGASDARTQNRWHRCRWLQKSQTSSPCAARSYNDARLAQPTQHPDMHRSALQCLVCTHSQRCTPYTHTTPSTTSTTCPHVCVYKFSSGLLLLHLDQHEVSALCARRQRHRQRLAARRHLGRVARRQPRVVGAE